MFLSEKSIALIKGSLPTARTIKDLSDFFSVFADSTRIKILTALLISEMSVTDISGILAMNQSTISHQLKTLRAAKIVETTRKGKIIMYGLSAGIDKVLEQSYNSFLPA